MEIAALLVRSWNQRALRRPIKYWAALVRSSSKHWGVITIQVDRKPTLPNELPALDHRGMSKDQGVTDAVNSYRIE